MATKAIQAAESARVKGNTEFGKDNFSGAMKLYTLAIRCVVVVYLC